MMSMDNGVKSSLLAADHLNMTQNEKFDPSHPSAQLPVSEPSGLSPTRATTIQPNQANSSNNGNMNGAESMHDCRICLERDLDVNLCMPCRCSGTMRYSHAACLQEWIREKRSTRCEVCQQEYLPPWPDWARANNIYRRQLEDDSTSADYLDERAAFRVLPVTMLVCLVFSLIVFLAAGRKFVDNEAAVYLLYAYRLIVFLLPLIFISISIYWRRRLLVRMQREDEVLQELRPADAYL
eukprot:GILK01011314.1.p1 GENE.GILK01011314.1~~GILK01011314.1.p1  ORF type:complete len:238 (+),score=18.86 GILK01011314.1:102-815(+)